MRKEEWIHILPVICGLWTASYFMAFIHAQCNTLELNPFGSVSTSAVICVILVIPLLFNLKKKKTPYTFARHSWIALAGTIIGLILLPLAKSAETLDTLSHVNILACIALIMLFSCAVWLLIEWSKVLSSLPTNQLLISAFASLGIECIIRGILFVTNAFASILVRAILDVLVILFAFGSLYWYGKKNVSQETRSLPKSEIFFPSHEAFKLLWRTALCLFVFLLIWQVSFKAESLYEVVINNTDFLGFMLDAILSAFVIILLLARPRPLGFAQIWRYLMLAFALLLLFMAFPETANFQKVISKVIGYLLNLSVWLLIADISRHSEVNTNVIACSGWLLYYLGDALARPLTSATGPLTFQAIILLLFVICVTTALLLNEHNVALNYILSDFASKPVMVDEFTSIAVQCKKIGTEKGLTDREIEVMQLICQGRSKAYIAESLFVSLSTVQGHSRNLYKKLDVHSKQELQQLIGL